MKLFIDYFGATKEEDKKNLFKSISQKCLKIKVAKQSH